MNKKIINYSMSVLLDFMGKQTRFGRSKFPLLGISIMNNAKISGLWTAEIDNSAIPWYEIDESLGHCYQAHSLLCVVLVKAHAMESQELDYTEIMFCASEYFLKSYGYRIYGYIHDPEVDGNCIHWNASYNAEARWRKCDRRLAEFQVDTENKGRMRYQYFFMSSLLEFIFHNGNLPQKNFTVMIAQCAEYLNIELVRDALCENLFNEYQDAYYTLLTSIARVYQGTANALLSLIAYDKGDITLSEHEALIGFYSFPYRNSFAGIVLKIIFSEISADQIRNNIELGSQYAKKHLEI